jgi:hypothetical protein
VGLIVALFMLMMGMAMATIWTLDLRAGRGYEAPSGLLRAREVETGSLIAWHWLAEYAIAATLVLSAILVAAGAAVGVPIALIGLGALAYSSCNSLAWAMARSERRAYAIPMLVGLVGAAISIVALLVA